MFYCESLIGYYLVWLEGGHQTQEMCLDEIGFPQPIVVRLEMLRPGVFRSYFDRVCMFCFLRVGLLLLWFSGSLDKVTFCFQNQL